MQLRSSHDREIVRIAVPALGALAAEPLYVLTDTAIVGHLGTTELAALAVAATVLTSLVALCNFLAYGTTARVARMFGAGLARAAGRLAAQSMWLALGIGVGLAVLLIALASPIASLMGADGRTHSLCVTYMRISALGLPWALVALAGTGYLRGADQLRRPLVIIGLGNAVNVVLELLFVYGFDWGLAGSAWGTVIAQTGMGVAFVVELLKPPADSRRFSFAEVRPLLRTGGDILVRTAALLGSFTIASAVLARVGESSLAAHQIAFQLFIFLALVLDALAIAGQVLVGRALGSSDSAGASAAGARLIGLSVVVGCGFGVVLLLGTSVIPHAFTGDDAVIGKAEDIWVLFALMQPLGGAAFALDGILIGAEDTRFLKWSMVFASLCVFVPIALASLALDWGIVGVWAGLIGLMLARVVLLSVRFVRGRWAVVGAPA